MFSRILDLFPPHTHPLTLVSDPDGLLNGEAILVELSRGGFDLIQEDDPVLLRHRVEAARPFSASHPVIVITTKPLADLPFDLWQTEYRIQLGIPQFFPCLVYPVVRLLTPAQLEQLAECPPLGATLGRQGTIDYLLRHVFNADPDTLNQPHQLIAWLLHYHQSQSPLPALLRETLVTRLNRFPVYRSWKLAELIDSAENFSRFVQAEWGGYLQSLTNKNAAEPKESYRLAFAKDDCLQELMPSLVYKRVLTPLDIPSMENLPDWAQVGVTQQDNRLGMIQSWIEDLCQQVQNQDLANGDWSSWKAVASQWAQLNALWFDPDIRTSDEQKRVYIYLCQTLDEALISWLKTHYTPLGAQRLPAPKHVFHVPHYLAYLRSLGKVKKLAMLVLDGMSFSDWQLIQASWGKRHETWKFQTDQLLAQIPTITSLSRCALISGQRPADFAIDLDNMPPEAKKWDLFWSNEGVPAISVTCKSISLDRGGAPVEIENSRLEVLCLIDDTLDKLTHNATLGTIDQQSSLRLWLEPERENSSHRLEILIDDLLERQFTVFISSDHGHVEATGFGQPSEGLLAQTRGKRARLYQDRLAAKRVQETFPDTILWENDGINPANLFALMPVGRNSFSSAGGTVVTHGGLSVDEVIVPLIQINRD